ncbi:hypothetical protein [Streptomyces wuyuanensis]|uniref:Uncharacterized protein n=1 Tax=Streptomyces wuyuanensis TaxID=1196353 RepID=A0A1G9ZSG0_9ACTN|nr:hypothetical protein [Streptomyces wuyuanensis]SDN24150.1 hypothetical protein SAMN05444921_12287 [Streptomyces wuyuanensis]
MITAGSDANGVTEAGYRNAMSVALALLAVGVVTSLLIRRPGPATAVGEPGEESEEQPRPVLSHH